MMTAFDNAWGIVKMGQEHDDEERRLIQHIVSMAMGMNDDEAGDYGMGYLDALQGSGKELSDLVSQRYGETGGVKGGYMREGDLDAYLDDWPHSHMDDEAIDGLGLDFTDDDAYEQAMQAWLKENPYTPRPSDVYEPPSMMRGVNPEVVNMLRSASPEQIEMIREMLG